MIRWTEKWLPEARDDMKKLGEPRKSHVYKAIKKVRADPLPQSEGGYGKPLGNRSGNNLTGLSPGTGTASNADNHRRGPR